MRRAGCGGWAAVVARAKGGSQTGDQPGSALRAAGSRESEARALNEAVDRRLSPSSKEVSRFRRKKKINVLCGRMLDCHLDCIVC